MSLLSFAISIQHHFVKYKILVMQCKVILDDEGVSFSWCSKWNRILSILLEIEKIHFTVKILFPGSNNV